MALPTIEEYVASISNPALVHVNELSGGHLVRMTTGAKRVIKYSGGFCCVFPYETTHKKYAVRCWHAAIEDAKERTKKIAEALAQSGLPYFVKFEYIDRAIATPKGLQPIVLMDWVSATPLKEYIERNLHNQSRLLSLAEAFKKMAQDLHEHQFAHGDLQHGNIMVRDDGSIILVDYDSMFVPGLENMPDEIKGLPGYQHPAREDNQKANEKLDYFSELIIYLSILVLAYNPSLATKYKFQDSESMLFFLDDFKNIRSSQIFRDISDLKDKNKNIPLCLNRLCEYLDKSSIGDLVPLEDVVIDPLRKIIDVWPSPNPRHKTKPSKPADLAPIVTRWPKPSTSKSAKSNNSQLDVTELVNNWSGGKPK